MDLEGVCKEIKEDKGTDLVDKEVARMLGWSVGSPLGSKMKDSTRDSTSTSTSPLGVDEGIWQT